MGDLQSSNCDSGRMIEAVTSVSLPKSLENWDITDIDDPEALSRDFLMCREAWNSLGPFFASKGYNLYKTRPKGSNLDSPIVKEPVPEKVEYPYAPLVFGKEQNMSFGSGSGVQSNYLCAGAGHLISYLQAVRVWPAVDIHGRHVVIKVVADDRPSHELEILEFLNSKQARSDPRNHTIPVIEFLRYDKFVFVVMPRQDAVSYRIYRWGQAFWPDFGTVQELLHLTHSFLEVFDFLHENRIIHGDFLEQNTAMNVLYPDGHWYIKGLRKPSYTRYALLDFGFSLKYPQEKSLEDIQVTRDYNFLRRSIPHPGTPYNPFKVDIIGVHQYFVH
ncbi:hypothetical protein CVT26_009138 [Gymnopilus dilepis]|uniref:Protein kinase domain-containing protein n=1 Tax=Gymnopilus dilepis TaxID=231916 RepID=A0A409YRH8_9AGAR|nr:hypothetical protein CVT26_009138 [Gymnopilus dilepis]